MSDTANYLLLDNIVKIVRTATMSERGLNKTNGEVPTLSETQLIIVNLVKAMGESIRNEYNSPTRGGLRPIRLHQEYFLEHFQDRYYEAINSALPANPAGVNHGGHAYEELARAIATFNNLVTGSNRVIDETVESLMLNSLKTILQADLLVTSAIELINNGQSSLYYGTTHWSRQSIETVRNTESWQVEMKELTLLYFSPTLARSYLAVIYNHDIDPE